MAWVTIVKNMLGAECLHALGTWARGLACQTFCNAKEAIEVYIESLLEDGLPVPAQTDAALVEVEVSAK